MGKRRDWVKIGEIVRKIEEYNLNYKEGAKEFGIPTSVIYEYNRKKNEKETIDYSKVPYISDSNENQHIEHKEENNTSSSKDSSDGNKDSYTDDSKEPPCIPDKEKIIINNQTIEAQCNLPKEICEIIITYRKENPDHGYKRIEDHLKSCHFVVVTRKKIRAVLKASNLHISNDSSFDKDENPPKGTRRFEAPCPRDLYQIDVTYVYMSGIPILYLVMIIDDYSRFCVGSELCQDQRGATLIEVLHKAINNYGKPRCLLTDQGAGFYSWSNHQTMFQNYLDDMQIEHIVADPHSPQTLGYGK